MIPIEIYSISIWPEKRRALDQAGDLFGTSRISCLLLLLSLFLIRRFRNTSYCSAVA